MARKLRVEFEGALYHVLNRGDRRENIFYRDADRELFLDLLGQACLKTGWKIHAYVLMSNHYNLMLETPQPNLVAGMKKRGSVAIVCSKRTSARARRKLTPPRSSDLP